MPSVFVNYRTGDAGEAAALVERELSARFGSQVFFRASKSIPLGADFSRELLKAVRGSDALLAFIGPHWLDKGADGLREIDREEDWPRREIIEAFDHDVRVIPVLVGSARPLGEKELPLPLARLAFCQYARLDHRNQDADLDMLATRLADVVPGLRVLSPGDAAAAASGISGGIVNHTAGDTNIGVQADTINGSVSFGDVGPFRERGR